MIRSSSTALLALCMVVQSGQSQVKTGNVNTTGRCNNVVIGNSAPVNLAPCKLLPSPSAARARVAEIRKEIATLTALHESDQVALTALTEELRLMKAAASTHEAEVELDFKAMSDARGVEDNSDPDYVNVIASTEGGTARKLRLVTMIATIKGFVADTDPHIWDTLIRAVKENPNLAVAGDLPRNTNYWESLRVQPADRDIRKLYRSGKHIYVLAYAKWQNPSGSESHTLRCSYLNPGRRSQDPIYWHACTTDVDFP